MFHAKVPWRRLCDGGSNTLEGRELRDERGHTLGFCDKEMNGGESPLASYP
jgi:hypothetical protein